MTHELKLRVYYEDTDAAGVAYHASYIRFAERGRTEMLRAAGFEHAKLFQEEGIAFAVASLAIDYKSPARLDDLLIVKTKIARVGGASMDMTQGIYRDSLLLAEVRLTLVCVDKSFKAARLPSVIKDIFEKGV